RGTRAMPAERRHEGALFAWNTTGRFVMTISRRSLGLATLATIAIGLGAPQTVFASPDKPVIALSNSYYGNTWRRQMVDAFTAEAEKAKAEGKIADFVVLNGDGSVNQQNSQMAELILRGVDAIAINAASETALNGLAEKACAAGIK